MRLTLLLLLSLSVTVVYGQDSDYSLDEKYSISKSGTLYLRTDDANVTIKGSNRSDVHVDITRKVDTKGVTWGSDEFTIEVEERDGDLLVKENNRSSYTGVIGYIREEYEVVIEVPHSVNLELKGDDDDYRITDVSGEVYINADDSDITLRNCTGDSFRFDIDDGDIDMDKGNGSLVLDIDDGDTFIEDATFTSMDVSMDDGEFTVETTLSDDGDYDIRSSDGRINIVVLDGGGIFKVSHDDSSVRASDEFDLKEREENRTVFELDGGNARLQIRCDDSRVNFSIL